MGISKLTALLLSSLALSSASPVQKRDAVSDVVSQLNNPAIVPKPSDFCTSLLALQPVTSTATKTKTKLVKLQEKTTSFKTATLTGPTSTFTTVTYQTSIVVETLTGAVLVVTEYVAPTPLANKRGLAERALPKAFKSVDLGVLSAACSSYITVYKTKTVKAAATVTTSTTKTNVVVKNTKITTTPTNTATRIDTLVLTQHTATQFQSTTTITSTLQPGQAMPTTYPGNEIWSPAGCYKEPRSNRVLRYLMASSSDMTAAQCVNSYCQGYQYAGIEYGGECWCDNKIQPSSFTADMSDCSMLCNGDNTEFCGNGNRLTVYQASKWDQATVFYQNSTWDYQGCYAEPADGTAMRYRFTDDATEAMTAEKCLGICSTNGYSYAGAEFGRECWCDNTLAGGAIVAPESCNFPCEGSKLQQCGASRIMNLYRTHQDVAVAAATQEIVSVEILSSPDADLP